MSATTEWLEYAAKRKAGYSEPVRSAIELMIADPDVPGLFPNHGALEEYLWARGVWPYWVPDYVWQRYRYWLDRHPFRRPVTKA